MEEQIKDNKTPFLNKYLNLIWATGIYKFEILYAYTPMKKQRELRAAGPRTSSHRHSRRRRLKANDVTMFFFFVTFSYIFCIYNNKIHIFVCYATRYQ